MRYIEQGTVRDGEGRIVAGATISVFLAGLPTPASIYVASTGGTAVNLVTSSSNGSFLFYVDDGDYATSQLFDVVISKGDRFDTITYYNRNIFKANSVIYTVLAGEVDGHETGGLDLSQLSNTIIHNYGQTDDNTQSLPLLSSGTKFDVILGTTVAKYFRLDPDDNQQFYLDGVALGNGKYIGVTSCVAGYALSCRTFKTGANSWSIYCSAICGPWTSE